MKILYVSDNRCRENYGCRATSTALSQLIGSSHEIVGHISGMYTYMPGDLVFNKGWSRDKYTKFSKRKYFAYWAKLYCLFHRGVSKIKHRKFLLGEYDFVSYDLDLSIENLIKCLPANPHISEYDLRQYDFDAMVVNGEGSFIFAKKPWRESMILLMLMHWAQKLGKKVYFMNAMLSDDPNSEHNDRTVELANQIFSKCEIVQVREDVSFAYTKKHFPELENVYLKPDALFTWYPLVNDDFEVKDGKYFMPFGRESDEFYYAFDFSKPYILIAGSSSSRLHSDLNDTIKSYEALTNHIKNSFPSYNVYLIITCGGDDFFYEVGRKTKTNVIPAEMPIVAASKILANASLFVTGRYHPAILASLGGTPCVFMGSNSHKTYSLQVLLEYKNPVEFDCLPNDGEIARIINASKLAITQDRIKIQDRAFTLSKDAQGILDLIK